MPLTLFDKIWNSHLVARRADGRDLIYIDRHVLHELHAPHAFEVLQKQQRPVPCREPAAAMAAFQGPPRACEGWGGRGSFNQLP